MNIKNISQKIALGIGISLGTVSITSEAKAQEQETKPTFSYPNIFKDLHSEKPKDDNLFWEQWAKRVPNHPDFERDLFWEAQDENYIPSRNDEHILNAILIFSGLGAAGLIFLFAIRNFINYTDEKSKELEETLRFVKSRSKPRCKKEVYAAMLKILRQRSGIDPALYE